MYVIISLVLILLPIKQAAESELNSFEVREHSLTRPYPAVFSTAYAHWHLTGNTIVTDRYVRLTFDTQSRSGGLWNSIPVSYSDWEMHVSFRVHGSGTRFFGDGFAIWYVRDPKLIGPVLGYVDHFYGLGIFLDTYANREESEKFIHPYISVMINNGTLHYDHDMDGLPTAIAGCSASFRDREGDTSIAVRYQKNRLIVSTDLDGLNEWNECFTVENVYLPTMYHFGFTAATGQLTDYHDILSIRTYRLDSSGAQLNEDRRHLIPSGPPATLYNAKDDASQGSRQFTWKRFFQVFGIIFFCLVGGLGFFSYWKQHRHHRVRFY